MKTIVADIEVRIPNLDGDGIAETHIIQVPVEIDPVTGEELLTQQAVELIETTKARYMGLLLPEEIKALRKDLNLTQKQMSELLQAGEKSYTRWENGKARPSRIVNLLLRLLYEGKVSVQSLHGVIKPRCEKPMECPEEIVTHDWLKLVEEATHGKFPTTGAQVFSDIVGCIQHNYAAQHHWDKFVTPAKQPRIGIISRNAEASDYERQKNSREYRQKAAQICEADETFPTSA